MIVTDLLVPSLVESHSGLKSYNTSSQTDTNHLFYRERKKDNTDVATGMNYGVASFFSWSKATCNPKWGITRIRGPWQLLPPFEGEHLERVWTTQVAPISKGKPLGFHMVG